MGIHNLSLQSRQRHFFACYHGLGNDYLVLDPNKNDLELQTRNIERLCRRNFGAGADGLLYGPLMEEGKIKVRIFNSDGSEAEKSGQQ